MTYDIKVEIAFNAGYRTPAVDRVWTDVTAWVDVDSALGVTYGRADELSAADANRLTNITLDNRDGRFTFGKTSSPYYPNVKVGRPIRITATAGATTSVRFTGYVDEWPQEWPGSSTSYATAKISSSSRISRLGLTSAPTNFLDAEILAQAPTYYWPLTDAATESAGIEAAGSGPSLARASEGFTLGAGGLRESESAEFRVDGRTCSQVIRYNDNAESQLTTRARAVLPTPITFGPGVPGAFSIGVFVRATATSINGFGQWLNLMRLGDDLALDNSPHFQFGASYAATTYSNDGTGAGWNATASMPVTIMGPTADLNAHHWGATVVCDGTIVTVKSYFDGQLVASTPSVQPIEAYALDLLRLTADMSGPNLLIGRVALWDRDIGAAGFAAIGGVISGYSGETVDQRMARVATTWAGIPSAEVLLPGSSRALGGTDASDGLPRPLDLLRTVERDEAGVLSDDRLGRLRLLPRGARYGVAPALTVDAALHRVGGDWAPKADRQGLANIGTAKNTQTGVEVTYIDEDSRDEYGDAAFSIDTSVLDPDEPLMLAAGVVNANREPRPRAPSVTLDVNDWLGSPAELAALLALDIGSRVRITNAPSQAATTSVDYYVEGYSESLEPFRWTITLNLSPSWPVDSVLILDDPALGVLDQRVLAL
ncbi:hypothetical protein [Pimelobacter simplex]|uniref:hypothetical protein n=1 Tax=Nocardioides simplex TaxID=2045 RepID=UPI0021501AAA|nr:hypothetical protein [Pimelobacter simplex]UUW87395.1 hypothetical protein M0M43_16770 [Pimelobacter simplex]UUW96900.1 hypothetical protein M0M48_05415 [Pimelobacter simplex]